MRCKNEFCIYQKNCKCVLNDIELDVNGICTSCMLINISQKTLNELKVKTLLDIESGYK